MKNLARQAALGVSVGMGLGFAWIGGPQDRTRETLELKDSTGAVRCRVGKLGAGDLAYGVEVLGGQPGSGFVLGSKGDATELRLKGPAGVASIMLRTDAEGSFMLLGDPDKQHVVLRVDEQGAVLACRGREGSGSVSVASTMPSQGGGQSSSVRVRSHRGDDSGDSEFLFETNASGAAMTASCDGVAGLRATVVREEGVSIVVGDVAGGGLGKGVRVQSLKDGSALLSVSDGDAKVILQSAAGDGAGLMVTKPDGRVAVRMGVTSEGEALNEVIDAAGKRLTLKQADAGRR